MTKIRVWVRLFAGICLLANGCDNPQSPIVTPNDETLQQDKEMQEQHEKQMAEYLKSLNKE